MDCVCYNAREIAQENDLLLNGSKAACSHALCLIMHFVRCIVSSQLAKELGFNCDYTCGHDLSECLLASVGLHLAIAPLLTSERIVHRELKTGPLIYIL